MKKIKLSASSILILFIVSLIFYSCSDNESIDSEKLNSKSENINHQKINYLKKGLTLKVNNYNQAHQSDNFFHKKYGELDSKKTITINFPKKNKEFIVVIPFKKNSIKKNKLLIGYYKNNKRKFKIFENIDYTISYKSSKLYFLEEIGFLFELISDARKKSNCRFNVSSSDYSSCTVTYVDSCTNHEWTISTLGKFEVCGGELDEVVINGDNGNDDDDWDDDYDWNDDFNDDDDWDDDFNDDDWDDGFNDDGGGGSSNSDSNGSNDFINQNVWNTEDPYDDWNELTDCEKDFFKSNPTHLYNARGNKSEAQNAAKDFFQNCDLHNDIGDAFRHAYFATLNTHNMGYTNAKTLGDAHECDTPANELDQKQMDLHNNAWGYHYGTTLTYIDKNQFYTIFINAYNNGQIKTLETCD